MFINSKHIMTAKFHCDIKKENIYVIKSNSEFTGMFQSKYEAIFSFSITSWNKLATTHFVVTRIGHTVISCILSVDYLLKCLEFSCAGYTALRIIW